MLMGEQYCAARQAVIEEISRGGSIKQKLERQEEVRMTNGMPCPNADPFASAPDMEGSEVGKGNAGDGRGSDKVDKVSWTAGVGTRSGSLLTLDLATKTGCVSSPMNASAISLLDLFSPTLGP